VKLLKFGRILLLASPVGLAACSSEPRDFMREPGLSPVGSGLMSGSTAGAEYTPAAGLPARIRNFPSEATNLYTDKRVSKVGDIVTVVISINDKATFGNSTDRSRTSKTSQLFEFGVKSGSSSSQPSSLTTDTNSTSSTQGQGAIDRSEQIQVSVAAVVTNVLDNGNLVISGSQEVRVNYELRRLTVAGIIRPSDISRANTISYEKIVEARISYGGSGRLSDVQQPGWGQQIYDAVKPF
jgi:flagellar L-ring protein precursor FlgH